MDDERELSRPLPLRLLADSLAWFFFALISLPIFLLWMSRFVLAALLRVLAFGVLPATVLVLAAAYLPLALQLLALAAGIAWLTFLVLTKIVAGEPPDEELFTLLSVLAVAVGLFAAATFVLAERDWITVANWESVESRALASAGFYLWHFLDAIPLLDAPDALRWSEPLVYEDPWVGALLVLFKLVIIVPIVAALRRAWHAEDTAVDAPPEPQR